MRLLLEEAAVVLSVLALAFGLCRELACAAGVGRYAVADAV